MYYGILKSSANTGAAEELSCVFATPLSIINNAPEFLSDTLSLKRIVNPQGTQRWEIETELASENEGSNFLLVSVKHSRVPAIYVRFPQTYTSTDVTHATCTANAASAGAQTVGISQSPVTLKAGMFIRFNGHTKVYMIVSVSSTGASTANLEVYPKLYKAVAANETVKSGGSVTAYMTLDSTSHKGIKYNNGILANPGTIKLVEKL